MAYSVDGSRVAGAALLERADTVGERWFWWGGVAGAQPLHKGGPKARPPI